MHKSTLCIIYQTRLLHLKKSVGEFFSFKYAEEFHRVKLHGIPFYMKNSKIYRYIIIIVIYFQQHY